MNKSLFITFEGIDGAGKSTQIAMLKEYLESKGCKVLLTREPGGSNIGNSIRGILLDKSNTAMSPLAELLLYYADRAQHISEVIVPALEDGYCVICDRYFDSSYAYQLAGRRLDDSVLDTLNQMVVDTHMPDITFLMDLSLEESINRVSGRGESDRLELESLSFKERVRHGFLEQAKKYPQRIAVINAMQSPNAIFDDILARIEGSGLLK